MNPGPNYVGLVTNTDARPILGAGSPQAGYISLLSGSPQLVTIWNDSKAYIGLATIDIGTNNNVAIKGNVTLSDSKGFIGLVSIAQPINANVSLGASAQYIGLTTVVIGGGALASVATIYAVVNTAAAGQSSIVLDNSVSKIGFATVHQGDNPWITRLNSNVTLNTSVNWVGFATVAIGSGGAGDGAILDGVTATIKSSVYSTASGSALAVQLKSVDGTTANLDSAGDFQSDIKSIAAGANYIGLTSVNVGGTLPALSAGAAFIGLATVNIGSSNTVVLGAGAALAGIVTIANSNVRSLTGNVTLSDAKTYIGLTTTTLGAGTANIGFATIFQAFPGGATVYSGVISATGNTTVFVAPVSNLFFLKDLHISSLGRSEVEIRSGATTIIPFTSLSTTSGFHEYYGEYGKPSRAQADSLVVGLNGTATISYAATVRFGV